tara:strand:+ start:6903 stop:7091 length:189 start_codon:yes stop_codon:yes gene_type:complete
MMSVDHFMKLNKTIRLRYANALERYETIIPNKKLLKVLPYPKINKSSKGGYSEIFNLNKRSK